MTTKQQAPRRSRLLDAISLQHDRTEEAWTAIDETVRTQAIDGSICPDDLTAWYRLAVERSWWKTLAEAISALGTPTHFGAEIDTAQQVLDRAGLVLVQPPITGEPLPFAIAATLVEFDAVTRFRIAAHTLIDSVYG